MPYQFEQPNAHFKIRKEHDRRVKLTDDDKFDIKWLFEKENFTIHNLARFFNVDKRTIQFILYPERQEISKQHRKERGGSKIYYKRKQHTKQMKTHRHWKKELFDKNLLDNVS